MNFKLVKLHEFSGPECSVYTILQNGSSLFSDFIQEHIKDFKNEVLEIAKRIRAMAEVNGAREQYFRLYEGSPGDGVCAIHYASNTSEDEDPENLRLYCIRYGTCMVIVGGGAKKDVRAWQQDPVLSKHVNKMMAISKAISSRIREGDIRIGNGGFDFFGDLNFSDDD